MPIPGERESVRKCSKKREEASSPEVLTNFSSLLVAKLVHITIPESHNSRGWDSVGQCCLLHVRPVRGGESCLFQSTQAAQVAVETSTKLYQGTYKWYLPLISQTYIVHLAFLTQCFVFEVYPFGIERPSLFLKVKNFILSCE